ncbi:MAG: flavin-containing monooxygenase [Bacillota bacterium]|jgi:putative flavoprotein involved in K+ transport|uniref:flavin-containing monooxygenase n=1 Tax=Fictibacillus TaxID=1329200 RepID=UPI0018CFBB48|nr:MULTISPECIES: NAD(P)/FAD-dependent oxidoreductase [unclassified Fictibacillus]MBH0157163.1 NAD(P)-binding domain-containing protein [Fictibacillus sp. 5RED26]MBH0159484.1 NAD(P)-binding domain-containing protein [Fictibacillus sp. 26RED30]MBH0163717.1 NAD(P)-binding domain-containing protein [Fictibacillus sp. 7GRE50]MBH0169657.1 NAD(P)-binding domain-containing protein [Fictibacillus sp. 18YEL24]MBH0174157.1 NAD(P)-binding domain-containing protein [Fictibacillus sp. 23RED33]
MNYDVIVIGAGQAGLAMGYYLKKAKHSFLIIGKEENVGDVWRKRYDSLVLFTPRSYSTLPGCYFEGDQDVYPTKYEVADYLASYAEKFSLPLQLNTNVYSLHKEDNRFVVKTNQGDFLSDNVVVATGPFQVPFIPEFSHQFSNEVFQVHSSGYRSPEQLKSGSVLIVGGGNSGAQIAVELSKTKEVYLSVGHKMKFFPQVIGNKSIFWWFQKLGLLQSHVNTTIGRFLSRQPDPIFGLELKKAIIEKKVILKSRSVSVENDKIMFEDVSRVMVDNVVWATGFKSDFSWIQIEGLFDYDRKPIHQRGVTKVKGLYFLGLPWQYRRGSGLLYGVGNDAEYLMNHMNSLQ